MQVYGDGMPEWFYWLVIVFLIAVIARLLWLVWKLTRPKRHHKTSATLKVDSIPKSRGRLCPKCKGKGVIRHPGLIVYFFLIRHPWTSRCDQCGGTGRVDR